MRKKLLIIASLFFLTFASVPDAQSQWVQTTGPGSNNFKGCFAESVGNLYVAGTGGVFRSTDNGTSWTVRNSNSLNAAVISMAIINKNLFAGTIDQGVFLSTNNGGNWTTINTGLPANTSVSSFVVRGANLFAGTNGHGVFKSSDDGASWTSSNGNWPNSNIRALATIGTNLFAGTEQDGILQSSDEGKNWTQVNTGLPKYLTPFVAVIASGQNLFASTYDTLFGPFQDKYGVFLSTNNGANWSTVNTGLTDSTDVNSFAVSGSNLFAGSYDGHVFLTTNNGTNWTAVDSGLVWEAGSVYSLIMSGTNIFAEASEVWRRPLSDFGNSSVTNIIPSTNSLTNFPNPFSQSTSIKFSTSDHSLAQVSIHNLLGSEVARLFSGELEGGEHSFNWDAQGMGAGMYVALVKVGGEVRDIPIVLVK